MPEIPTRPLGRTDLQLTELSLGAAFIGGRDDPSLDDPDMASERFDDIAVDTVQRALAALLGLDACGQEEPERSGNFKLNPGDFFCRGKAEVIPGDVLKAPGDHYWFGPRSVHWFEGNV